MNTNELKAEVIRKGITLGEFGEEVGLAKSTLSKRLKEPNTFKLDEIRVISEYLELDNDDIARVFLGK